MQRAMMTKLATGGRLGVAIGVAGAGQEHRHCPAGGVEAWQADGRAVFGITLAGARQPISSRPASPSAPRRGLP
jgi:hypothetical protein